jgi:hypothetical protein
LQESIEYAAVSAVGFDATKTKAIAHVHVRNSGGLYFMEKRDGKWLPSRAGGYFWAA